MLIDTRRDIRSNEAAMKYLLMGEVCVSIRVHSLSWLYGSIGGKIELKGIANGLNYEYTNV